MIIFNRVGKFEEFELYFGKISPIFRFVKIISKFGIFERGIINRLFNLLIYCLKECFKIITVFLMNLKRDRDRDHRMTVA